MTQPIARTRSAQIGAYLNINESAREAIKLKPMPTWPMSSSGSGHSQISVPDVVGLPPPCAPTVSYYYSRRASDNICYIYRVNKSCKDRARGHHFKCLPEAQGWPEMNLMEDELQTNFLKLEDRNIYSNTSELSCAVHGEALFPSLPDLKKWQVGVAVRLSHYDVRTTGLVVGRFVWKGKAPSSATASNQNLTLVLLLQTPTNKLLLSSQVTDLAIEDMEAMTTRGEVYIQGISLLAIVATLIANVTYLAMVNPPKGKQDTPEVLGVLPVTFTFFNAVAFYSSVLAVVVMTAFIPIFGTAGQWRAIFLSGSMPVVMGLVSFYIAFIISAWTEMDCWPWVKPLAITLLGFSMVIYVYIWAIQLMNGHIEHDLRIQRHMTPWDWYVNRTGRPGSKLARLASRLKFMHLLISNIFVSQTEMPSVRHTIGMSRSREQQAYLFGKY